MRTLLPPNTRLLLDYAKENGIDETWRRLCSGSLVAVHWHKQSGKMRSIDQSVWLANATYVAPGGKVITAHPADMIEAGNLSWIRSGSYVDPFVGDDPVIVPYFTIEEVISVIDTLVAIGRESGGPGEAKMAPDELEAKRKGGRRTHPAKAWYAQQGFERGQRTMNELQREMENDLKCAPPAEQTIRDWESEARNVESFN